MPGSLSNWKFLSCLQAEKQSGREISRGETSGHKSGALASVLALGPSTHPKNVRDLTVSCLCTFTMVSSQRKATFTRSIMQILCYCKYPFLSHGLCLIMTPLPVWSLLLGLYFLSHIYLFRKGASSHLQEFSSYLLLLEFLEA
jgi:hypothetical protein